MCGQIRVECARLVQRETDSECALFRSKGEITRTKEQKTKRTKEGFLAQWWNTSCPVLTRHACNQTVDCTRIK